MGCSGRVKADDIRPEQKWDFISLNDFHATSCFEFFWYAYLWLSLLISLAVYGVDTFTAVNLLAFDKWSSSVEPAVDFDVQKWIFAGCIMASWVNLCYEHLRAVRVMKRGAVAENFMDSLAVRLQSIRLGEGRGWRRFLVFSELTKSRKGAEYVALFTFFGFQSWIRILLCQGPRQVLNALTLWAVVQSFDSSAGDAGSTLLKFFKNVGKLADENHQQAVVYSGMLFTLVIWTFGALSLLLSALFYVFFLWHYIPNADGGLTGYCERKVNRRLAQIVSVKVNKALEEEERRLRKLDAKAVKKGEQPLVRHATLPTLFAEKTDDGLPAMPMWHRNDTMTTLPQYSSRPGTPSGQPPLPSLDFSPFDQKRPATSRSGTASTWGSHAPLMGHAADMGQARSGAPAPHLPPVDIEAYPAPPQRSMTASSNTSSNWSRGPPAGPPRMPSAMGDRGHPASPMSLHHPGLLHGAHPDSYGRPRPRAVGESRSHTPTGSAPGMSRRHAYEPRLPHHSSSSPSSGDGPVGPPTYAGYQPYHPARSASPGPGGPSYPAQPPRNMTDPGARGPPQWTHVHAPLPRPGTAQTDRSRGPGGSPADEISRLASPAPYHQGPGPNFTGPGAGPYRP
ncbi:pheromone-regulated membrane protein [Diplocarpon rosae]|nr:pheromone-regulated membrane protein [Diplocarpon rosae]